MALHSYQHDKIIVNFLENHPDIGLTDLETFYANTAPISHGRVNDQFFIYDAMSSKFVLVKCDEVRWVFNHNITVRTMGFIPTGRIHEIYLFTSDGQFHALFIRGFTEKKRTELLRSIYPHMKNAVFGYSKELEKAWKEDCEKGNDCMGMAYLGRLQHQRKAEY